MNDDEKLKQLHDEASTYLAGGGDMGLALILKTVPDGTFDGLSPKKMAYYLNILQDDDAYYRAIRVILMKGFFYGLVVSGISLYAFSGWLWQVIVGVLFIPAALIFSGTTLVHMRERYSPLVKDFRAMQNATTANEKAQMFQSLLEKAKNIESSS